MTIGRRAVYVLWPLALLILFLGTFRQSAADTAESRNAKTAKHATVSSLGDLCVQDRGALERCVAEDPANVELLTRLGAAYETGGRGDLAEAAYRRALALDPRDGDVHVRLGELLLKRGDRAGAHAEADAALRWHPASAPAVDLAERSSPALAMSDR